MWWKQMYSRRNGVEASKNCSWSTDRVDFSSFAAFKQTIEQIDFSQFYSAMTTELVLAELLCCDCVFCNSLVFYVSTFYFILWAVVSAGYSALLSSSYWANKWWWWWWWWASNACSQTRCDHFQPPSKFESARLNEKSSSEHRQSAPI